MCNLNHKSDKHYVFDHSVGNNRFLEDSGVFGILKRAPTPSHGLYGSTSCCKSQ